MKKRVRISLLIAALLCPTVPTIAGVIATDGNVPVYLDVEGTQSDPSIYIIGYTNAYTRDYGTTPLFLGWDGKYDGYFGSNGRSYVQLHIQNGSTVISGDGSYVGYWGGKKYRIVRLTDASSWIVNGELVVGTGQGDRLEVYDGSLVTTTNLSFGGDWSSGYVMVSNANSRVISTGDLIGPHSSGGVERYSVLELYDNGLVRVDGDSAGVSHAYFRGGYFAWAGDHTGDNPFNSTRLWNGSDWQEFPDEDVLFTATYYATDAEAKAATADPDSGFEGYDGLGGYTIWESYLYEEPPPDVVLTVESAHGAPVPSVGLHTNAHASSISCSVADVTESLTQYSCTGWTLTGNDPSSGTTNAFELTLTNNATLTWNWETNVWLDINVSGNGSVDVADGFYAENSEQILTATPDAGWLFMGWSGDASGTNSEAFVFMTEPQTVTATFSDDADGDGLTNTEEASHGSNPWKTDTDGDGFDDKTEVDYGLSPTNDSSGLATYIEDNDETFGLYPSNVVLDVAVGEMLLDVTGSEATLNLQLETSDDLQSWTNAGPAQVWSWTVDGEKKFFRVKSTK